MLHRCVQELCPPCAWGGSKAQDLWQPLLSLQLLLRVAPHYLIVDRLFVGVMTLVNDQQSDICKNNGCQSPFVDP